MRRYDIDLGLVADEAHSSRLEAIDAALSGAQVAIAEVGIGQRALLSGVSGRQPKIPWRIVLQQKRRGKVKASLAETSRPGYRWSSLKKTMPHEWGGHGVERTNKAPLQRRRPFGCIRRDEPTELGGLGVCRCPWHQRSMLTIRKWWDQV